jgi:flagellar hook-associated protein 3 FlgL
MTLNALGDLAQSFMLRRQNVQVRQEIGRLTEEMTTGRTSAPLTRLSGDYTYLADIERNLGLITGFRTAAVEAAIFTDGMQTVLTRIQETTAGLSRAIFDVTSGELGAVQGLASKVAADAFEQVVNALNTRVADRSLFAGRATNQAALAEAATMIADLKAAIGNPNTADELRNAVNQWFDMSGGGFELFGYLGASQGLEPHRLGRGNIVDLDLRADTPVLRDVLKQTSLSILATDPAFPLSAQDRADLLRGSAAQLVSGQARLTSLRADLGFAQERIEEGKVRLGSEQTSLEMARNAFLSVDPFETATHLQSAQSRLESLYAVTVRLSRLSLSEFMR